MVKKIVKRAKKRYVNKRGGPKIRKMIRDVKYLKSIVNAEKKRIKIIDTNQVQIGQFGASSATTIGNAFLSLDITPYPTLGDTSYNRSGSSIKLHTSYIKIRVDQNSNLNMSGKIRVVLIQVLGVPQTSAGNFAITRMFLPEPWITVATGGSIYPDGTFNTGNQIVNANSNYNPDYRGEYRIIMDRTRKMQQKNYGGSAAGIMKEFTFPLKWNKGKGHHIRYSSVSNTGSVSDLTNGQLFMYILADVGNSTSTVYTGTGASSLPTTGANSGYLIDYDITHYYYDN